MFVLLDNRWPGAKTQPFEISRLRPLRDINQASFSGVCNSNDLLEIITTTMTKKM